MAAKRSLLRIVLIGVGTVLGIPLILLAAWPDLREEALSLTACYQLGRAGFRPVAEEPSDRFLGKVQEFTARCRGGSQALVHRDTPWTGAGATEGDGGRVGTVTPIGEIGTDRARLDS